MLHAVSFALNLKSLIFHVSIGSLSSSPVNVYDELLWSDDDCVVCGYVCDCANDWTSTTMMMMRMMNESVSMLRLIFSICVLPATSFGYDCDCDYGLKH